jgi:hypothetical protein
MDSKKNRQSASQLAQQFLNGQITFKQFVDNYPMNTKDRDIDSLFDLIEHQPKLGGFLGVSQSTYDKYNSDIYELIENLNK